MIVLPVFVAVLGLTLVQRLVPPRLREEHNDVAGFIYAVVGVVYAVLLAFVVIAVWEGRITRWPRTQRTARPTSWPGSAS